MESLRKKLQCGIVRAIFKKEFKIKKNFKYKEKIFFENFLNLGTIMKKLIFFKVLIPSPPSDRLQFHFTTSIRSSASNELLPIDLLRYTRLAIAISHFCIYQDAREKKKENG